MLWLVCLHVCGYGDAGCLRFSHFFPPPDRLLKNILNVERRANVERGRPIEKGSSLTVIIESIQWKNVRIIYLFFLVLGN